MEITRAERVVICWPPKYFAKVKHLNALPAAEVAEWLKNEAARTENEDPVYSFNLWMAHLAALGGNFEFKEVGTA